MAVHFSKQQALDVDRKVMKQISFTANLDRDRNTAIIFIIEEAKGTVFNYSQGSVKVL